MDNNRQIEIEKVADNVRSKCEITGYGFKNIFEAISKIGYKVIRYPIGEESFLGFALVKEGDKIIFSNSSLILAREIFSVAHEIGHHELHLSEDGLSIIKDDNFENRDQFEIEANYFAACLLMPREKVQKFIRLELSDKEIDKWNGLDIAKIQTEFSVSYDMVLIRLKELGILTINMRRKLTLEKIENKISRLLGAINGDIDLCRKTNVKKVPAEYLEWVISNYTEKLIPIGSLEKSLRYVDLSAEDLDDLSEEEEGEDDDTLDDIIGRIE